MDARDRHQQHHGAEEEADDDEEEDEDDDEDDDDYDFDGGGDAVDDVANGTGGTSPASDGLPGPDPGLETGLSRARRSCWPPPPLQPQTQPRAPVWAPLFRVQPSTGPPSPAQPGPRPRAPPPRFASQTGPSGPPRNPPPRPAQGRGQGRGQGRVVPPPRTNTNPVYGNRMRLYCRTGFHLSIGPKGRVTGTANPNDKYAVLEFSSVTNGEVRIRGVEANLFLAMNRQGKLYGQANVRQEGTVFVEMMLGQYNTYLSRKFAHVGWYVGIKKNGRQKLGQKTAWGQKAIQFLPIRV